MKASNKNKFVKGNIKSYSGSKGYIIGQFMGTRGFPQQETNEVEIAWKKLSAEDSHEVGHFHKTGVETNIVIKGSFSVEVGEKKLELKKGDFLIVYPETVLKNLHLEDDVEIIVVKAPSVPDDKFNVKE